MKVLIAACFLCACVGSATAQGASTAKTPVHKSASTAVRGECVAPVGLCVTVPAGWQRLGDVFEDLGFVVAEPHAGSDSAGWPQMTVAAIDVPAEKSGGTPTLDSLVDIVLTPDGSFSSVETLQRTHLVVNGSDAEIVRVQLNGDAAMPVAMEAVALIQGDEGLVYSIALRCAPGDFARLEPVFQKTVHSWRIKQVEVVPESKTPANQTPPSSAPQANKPQINSSEGSGKK